MGKGGEIFVLDMGKPVNIKDIAFELIRLSGLEPEKDISIEYIGTRPGEKLYEELKTSEESVIRTNHEKILMMKSKSEENWYSIQEAAKKISESAKTYDLNIISKEISKYVPQFNIYKNSSKGTKKKSLSDH